MYPYLYHYTLEIHEFHFHCDIDGGSVGPAATDWELPTGPHATFSPNIEIR